MSVGTAGLSDGAVVVGVDGTDTSQRALAVAAELATGLGARLWAVHALGMMTVIDGEHVSAEGRQEDPLAASTSSDRHSTTITSRQGEYTSTCNSPFAC